MKICSISLAAVAAAGSALAASLPPTTQIMGTIAASSVANARTGYVCTLDSGRGEFQRPAATAATPNPPAMIAMPRTATFNQRTGGGYRASDGVVVLNFTTGSTGIMRIDFDYSDAGSRLPSGESVPFRSYREIWVPSTSTLHVTFDIVFDHCILPVKALFRAAP
jgi:hypothetical protein